MISRLIVTLKNRDDIRMDLNSSSLIQGVLMENIGYEYGEILHESKYKPYSQYIVTEGEYVTWVIQTVNEQAKKELIDRFCERDDSYVYIKHKNLKFEILEINCEQYSYLEIVNQSFYGDSSNKIIVEFVSPTVFRNDDGYINYPSIRKIFESLMHKFNKCSSKNTMISLELLDEIEECVKIKDYSVKSARFYMEARYTPSFYIGVYIPSFVGTVSFLIQGSQRVKNVVKMLLYFGEFSSVGLYTTLGMGGMKIK